MKKAKQLLSILLVLLMVFSLAPQVFADDFLLPSDNNSAGRPPYPNGQTAYPDEQSNYYPAQQSEEYYEWMNNYNEWQQAGGHTHQWVGYSVVTPASCSRYGEAVVVCQICGETKNIMIPKLDHIWGEWEILFDATDHTAGSRIHTCQVCGLVEEEKYYPLGTILPGAHGDAVEELQHLLEENGLLDRHMVDRDYGWYTEQAVKAAERDAGMEEDGIAWPMVMNHLRHDFGNWNYTVLPSYDTVGHKERTCSKCGYVEKVDIGKKLERGAYGDDVRRLQDRLTELGFKIGKLDGSFGRDTENAIKAIEEIIGRPADGIVWPGLWNKLFPDEDLQFDRDNRKPVQIADIFRPIEERPIFTFPDFVKAENDEEQEPQDRPALDVKIELTNSPSIFDYYYFGDPIEYDITVTNIGNLAFTKVALVLSMEPLIEGNEFSYTYDVLDNLAPGETVTVPAVQNTFPYISEDQKTSTTTVTAIGAAPTLIQDITDSDSVTFPVGNNPADAIIRIDSIEPLKNGDLYTVGDEIVVQATITNDGSVPLKHVHLTGGFFLFTDVADFDLALAPGESDSRTYTFTVTQEEQDILDKFNAHRNFFSLHADFTFDYEGKDMFDNIADLVWLPKENS